MRQLRLKSLVFLHSHDTIRSKTVEATVKIVEFLSGNVFFFFSCLHVIDFEVTLDVIVECAVLAAVLVQQTESINVCKVLKLNQTVHSIPANRDIFTLDNRVHAGLSQLKVSYLHPLEQDVVRFSMVVVIFLIS